MFQDTVQLVDRLSSRDAQRITKCDRWTMLVSCYGWLLLIVFGISYLGALVIEPVVNPHTHCTLCPRTFKTTAVIMTIVALLSASVAIGIKIYLVVEDKAKEADEFELNNDTKSTP